MNPLRWWQKCTGIQNEIALVRGKGKGWVLKFNLMIAGSNP